MTHLKKERLFLRDLAESISGHHRACSTTSARPAPINQPHRSRSAAVTA